MRKDMAKVIVERERHNPRNARPGKPPRDIEDLPSVIGMRREHSERKNFSENLNPLIRFLKKNVNRPWDKVYSEICENLKPTSTVHQHVRDHVWDYVHKDVEKIGTKIYENSRWRNGLELRNGDLFIHPDTKLLRSYRNKEKIPPRPERDPFLMALNGFVGTEKRQIFSTDATHNVHWNKETDAWDIIQPIGITQARVDIKKFFHYGPIAGSDLFFDRWKKNIKGDYLCALRDLFFYRKAAWERDEAARKFKESVEKRSR